MRLRLSARVGFTIAEMVVALLLFSMIAGGILTLVMRQQRFYRDTAEVIKLQGQLRQGASVMPLDLRGISTSDLTTNSVSTTVNADVYGKADWYMEFRRIFGSSVICRRRAVAPMDTIVLTPKTIASGLTLTSWGSTPVMGDSLLILDEGKMVGAGDDKWRAYEVRQVTTVTNADGCPTGPPHVLAAGDAALPSYKVVLDRALDTTVMIPVPVRVFRRVRYEIYQAGDEQWYLGYSDCLSTYDTWNKCSEVTPVSGPYRGYSGVVGDNGIEFAYYDSLGNALSTSDESRRIARVNITMRAQSARPLTRTGSGAGETYGDTVVLSIGIRNRR